MSPAKNFFQETPAQYRTLAVRQNEYYPQGSRRVEEFWVQVRAAEQPAAHPVCRWDGYCDIQVLDIRYLTIHVDAGAMA
jgi:alpha-ketoglutarate-dependent taurine dioxygenase